MTKRKKQKTIQWPKEKDRRQYKDQKKKTVDNAMTNKKRQNTIKWLKEKDRRQYTVIWQKVLDKLTK